MVLGRVWAVPWSRAPNKMKPGAPAPGLVVDDQAHAVSPRPAAAMTRDLVFLRDIVIMVFGTVQRLCRESERSHRASRAAPQHTLWRVPSAATGVNSALLGSDRPWAAL